jgi:hypothetical protein
MPLNPNVVAGMFEPKHMVGAVVKDKATNITITRGDICNRATGTTPDSYQTCPTSGLGPFVYALETVTAASADPKFSCIDYECEVMVTNDAAGAIEPGMFVQTSATVAGRIMAYAAGTTGRICGVYLRLAGQADGGTATTTLAANGVGIIRFLPNSAPSLGA